MKYVSLAAVIFTLFSFQSCLKTEKTNINLAESNKTEENLLEVDLTEEYLLDYELKKDTNQILTSKYKHGYEYYLNSDNSEDGKKLKKMQENLYLNTIKNTEQDNIFLTEEYRYKSEKYIYETKVSHLLNSIEYYFPALQYYQNNYLNTAKKYIEMALDTCAISVYFYHYGVFFMETGDYENAEKAFLKSLVYFSYYINPLDEYINNTNGTQSSLYTFDNNGVPREKYFAAYNLACIYSIRMELEKSLDLLLMAIEWGYPYIDHLFNDPDLTNLLNSSKNIKNQIQKIYDDGFMDTFSGKAFYYGRASERDIYYFINNRKVLDESGESALLGTYEVKNYHIFINYKMSYGIKGIGYIPGGGVEGAYERYEPYEKTLDSGEFISIKYMFENWKEVPNKYVESLSEKQIFEIWKEKLNKNR